MQRVRLSTAVALVLVGAIFVGQGLGYIPGSFMSGDPFWAWVGVGSIAIGAYLAWDARRRGIAG